MIEPKDELIVESKEDVVSPVNPTPVEPVTPVVNTMPTVENQEPPINSGDEKIKGNGLWKGLTILFIITTAVLAFLYLTKKEMMSVVIVNKDNNIKIEKVAKGKTISNKPVVTDEGFLGWYSNDKEFDFNTKIDKDYVVIAKYDERKEYTITFNTDGGSEIAPVKVKENDRVTMPTNPTKTNYLFNEWTLNGVVYDFNTPITKDIELKATWRLNDNTVLVRFDSDGGSNVASQKVAIGGVAKKPKNPTKSHYNFKEWQLDGVTYDFSKVVNKEITLKAVWTEKKKLTLSFDSNGGSSVNNKTVYENEAVGTLPTPTRSGYVFSKWELNGNTFNSNSRVTKDTKVKAVWKTVDEANYDKAYSAIKSSYDVTKDGQTITVTSSGCEITHDQIKTTNSQIVFHIKCGSKTGTKNVKANVKLPTYKYTVTPTGNMVNSYVKINGVTSGTICLKSSPSDCWSISGGQALVEDSVLNSKPVFIMKKSGDNTTYTVTRG